jgi:hypothetical protein
MTSWVAGTALVLAAVFGCASGRANDRSPEQSADAGPDPQGQPLTSLCAIQCLNGVYSEAGGAADCTVIGDNVAAVVELYAENRIATTAQVCALLSQVKLFVRPEVEHWETDEGDLVGGLYRHEDVAITMVQDMAGLGHESLHAVEDLRGVMDPSDPHRGWDTKPGYRAFLEQAPRRMCPQFSPCE